MLSLLRYAEFRRYQEQRQDANNAMIALLAGSKLAVHTLKLTVGSQHRLAEIFPSVEHIERFDLKTEKAQSILNDAESHLGTMAVPYVLAIHEDYLRHCCQLLKEAERMTSGVLQSLSPKTMHEKFEKTSGTAFTVESLALFHLLRTMRNSRIHEGGRVARELRDVRSSLTADAETIWEKLTKESLPPLALGDPVTLGQPHLIACLAVTNRLASEANEGLQSAYPTRLWAERLVADALSERPRLIGNPNQRFRFLLAIGRRYYSAVTIPEAELRAAARRGGVLA